MRVLDLPLDAARPVARDTGISPLTSRDLAAQHLKAQPFGSTFTVTASDTTYLTVAAHLCTPGEVDFGLVIVYDDNGVTRTYPLGSREHPYRVLAGQPGEVAVDGMPAPGTKTPACNAR